MLLDVTNFSLFVFGLNFAALPTDEVIPGCFKQSDQEDCSVHIIDLRNIPWQ